MAEKLTPQQEMAVHNSGGKLLVSAAAGSGKTKVLVDRLLRYILHENAPANVDEFLIITYTKAAASELRGKIASKLSEKIAENPENRHLQRQLQRLYMAKISTVHGFCGDILREYAYRMDISSDFRVADEEESRELRAMVLTDVLEQAYEKMDIPCFREFVDTQGYGRNDFAVPKLIEQVFNSARCHLNPEEWLEKCMANARAEGVTDAAETVWGEYLIQDLHSWLDGQIQMLSACRKKADQVPEFTKISESLSGLIVQLEELRNAKRWDDIYAKGDVLFDRMSFPRKNVDLNLKGQIQACRDACKGRIKKKLAPFQDNSATVLAGINSTAAPIAGLVELVRAFDREYTRRKRSMRIMDFGDLEHLTLDLLLGKSRSGPTAAADEIGQRFREIMVDEYQDSNAVQDAIFNALTRKRQNCFMVGDVKQSIYQFRLADPGIFLEKYNRYQEAENALPGEGRRVLLSHNFRSGEEVIQAVNAVFHDCMSVQVGGLDYGEAEELRMWNPSESLPDAGTELYVITSEENHTEREANFVAERIRQMIQQQELIRDRNGLRPVTEDDVAILLRAPGSVGKEYQLALERQGLRCNYSGGINLMETQEVSTLWALLKIISNPQQDIPLVSVMASPVFGFTADELAQIRSENRNISVYDALHSSEHPKGKRFLEILLKLREAARLETITGLLENCYSLTYMDSIFAAMPGGEVRKSNLETFFRQAAAYEMGGLRTLEQFLKHLDLAAQSGKMVAQTAAGGVTITSIHKSKGLEYPVVFLCNLSRGFNMKSVKEQILCDQDLGLGLCIADPQRRIRYNSLAKNAMIVKMTAESISEELRVLYVAMTRAKDRLIMTYTGREKKLYEGLKKMSQRIPLDASRQLPAEVSCLGDWILHTAIQRTEAGALRNFADSAELEAKVSDLPWKIEVVYKEEEEEKSQATSQSIRPMPENAEAVLRQSLAFSYPWIQATQITSKQTATGRKGRVRDEEAAEAAEQFRGNGPRFRVPKFLASQETSIAYGNAMHAAMQYIDYGKCGSQVMVKEELDRLEQEHFITPEQRRMVNEHQIAAFFQSPIGQRLRTEKEILREFKFSVLDDAANYAPGASGEQVLLQGVVDCAIIEEDGLTIVDYKTDRVTEENLEELIEVYRPQLTAYSEALSRIYERPVKKTLLYFFRLRQFVEI